MCQKGESSKTISEKKRNVQPESLVFIQNSNLVSNYGRGISVRDPTCVVRLISND
ncbi:hypothetical protein LEP1GSC132_2178 [Leptospira kirschneri str. 200803703]|nr:hypothetical protein LEP1GSC044_0882 [Leptospira kirschneri serovar Grippotyphosa str. RM52]EKP04069.1 hypothetical protein LEP1GSC018_4139 [Leptospira kirschneri str. 2008720114]EMK00189.1 hypothetical protein LEP1GSC176_3862 [Leptospira kirschneri str. MMD1493]EMN23939.1 hypothetical protein LEP1GSC065_0297 [Leptospira kirschneri serovar Sokoine str. RM1]EMO65450.1 hypothetical protein LEP1GSC132_2178 [Leptospira kirschneri str. 200803703]EMO79441.1 hypothetical protein LEP1GSC126_1358 [L